MSEREAEPNGTMRALAAGIAVAAVLIGIFVVTRDSGGDDGGSDNVPVSIDPAELVPATDASLAAVALEHIDRDPAYFEALYREDGRYPDGTVGADIRFGGGEGDDGDLLRLTASPGRDRISCEFGHCADIQTDHGNVLLFWQEEAPEEDPGIVAVSMQRDGMVLRVYASGPAITGDPRDLDLEISVDVMVGIVTDPRFGLETTPDMVEAGEELDGFPAG